MKKKITLMCLILGILAIVSACGENGAKEVSSAAQEETAPAVTIESAPEVTTAQEITTETAPETTEAAAAVEFVFERSVPGNDETATVTAYGADGSVMWTYATGAYPATELTRTTEIGCRDNGYYLAEGGKVVVLDKTDGSVVWECMPGEYGCGGSNYFCFDEEGALYISGYYGPDMTKIDRDGEMIWQVQAYDDYMWFYDLTFSDGVVECFATPTSGGMDTVPVRIDSSNGNVL